MDTVMTPLTARAMSCARLSRHRDDVGSAFRQRHLGLILLVALLVGTAQAAPAQITQGGAQYPPTTGGGISTPPILPGQAPDTLPPPPGGGFGLGSPFAPPNAVNNDIPPV